MVFVSDPNGFSFLHSPIYVEEKKHSAPPKRWGVPTPVCVIAPHPLHLVMSHPNPFIRLLEFFRYWLWFLISIVIENMRHGLRTDKTDLLFHNFGHYFHPLLSVLMCLHQLQDFSGEGSPPPPGTLHALYVYGMKLFTWPPMG